MADYVDKEHLKLAKFPSSQYVHIVPSDMIAISYKRGWNDALEAVYENAPVADVRPVVHGKWETVEDGDGDEHYKCSACGEEFILIYGTPEENQYYFCPNCGADMRERREQDG